MIDIQIQIHTRLAIPADEIAVSMANNTNIHPKIQIHHRKGKLSLFCIQKNINIPHLIKAHNANIHTINFQTKLASREQISTIQSIRINIHTTNKKEIY